MLSDNTLTVLRATYLNHICSITIAWIISILLLTSGDIKCQMSHTNVDQTAIHSQPIWKLSWGRRRYNRNSDVQPLLLSAWLSLQAFICFALVSFPTSLTLQYVHTYTEGNKPNQIPVVTCLTPEFSMPLCLSGFPQWLYRAFAAQPVRTKTTANSDRWHWAHPRAPLLWGKRGFFVNFIVMNPQCSSHYRLIFGRVSAEMFSTCLSGWRWVPRSSYWRDCPTQHQTRICCSPDTHST